MHIYCPHTSQICQLTSCGNGRCPLLQKPQYTVTNQNNTNIEPTAQVKTTPLTGRYYREVLCSERTPTESGKYFCTTIWDEEITCYYPSRTWKNTVTAWLEPIECTPDREAERKIAGDAWDAAENRWNQKWANELYSHPLEITAPDKKTYLNSLKGE